MNSVKSSKYREPYAWDRRSTQYSVTLANRKHYVRPVLTKPSYKLVEDFNLGHIADVPHFINGRLIDVHWESLHKNLSWVEYAFLLVSELPPSPWTDPTQFYLLFKLRRGSWGLWKLKQSAIEKCPPTFANYVTCTSFIKLGEKTESGSHIAYSPDFVELRQYRGMQRIIFWDEISQDVVEIGYNGISHYTTQKCLHQWKTTHEAMFLYTNTCQKCGISRSYDSSG